ISLSEVGSNEILISHIFNRYTRQMKGIRVFIHQDKMNYDTMNIANLFFTKLCKYGEQLDQKITNKIFVETYKYIESMNTKIKFHGIVFHNKRRDLKRYERVLRHPKPNYVEVKNDTFRLWIRDDMIERQIEIQKNKNKGEL
ncbi:MAG: hypothetical protein RBQ97_12290, partial [Acholeplasma sp.]|nr:hypothetical protein [Acholeplasma sp.]